MNAVDDGGRQIFIDRFGTQTISVPDDNYFLEGKGSALYKADLCKREFRAASQSQRRASWFRFWRRGRQACRNCNRSDAINSTKEAGTLTGTYFGEKTFSVNIDDGDQLSASTFDPKYNADQLANEVERAINEAYGDTKKSRSCRMLMTHSRLINQAGC